MEIDLVQLADKSAKPLLCLEVNPPRGVDTASVFERLDNAVALKNIDFLNVTDSALARMKFASLPFGALLKQRYGKDCMVNVSCRDRNVLALQSDLLAAWALGVRSVVALTGDAMSIGDNPERKGVFEVNSIGLLSLIATLNSGKDLAGNELKGAPTIIPGVVVNPNVKNPGAEIRRLIKKKEAGAQYALSQPVFDKDNAVAFLKEAEAVGIPIFIGLLPLKTAKGALAINKVPGIKLPEWLTAKMESAGEGDQSRFFIDLCMDIAQATRPYVRGFHVVSGATPLVALQLASELAEYRDRL